MHKIGRVCEMLRHIKAYIYKCYTNIKWKHQMKKLIIHSCKACQIKSDKALFIVPHADDELIGGYNYLRKNEEMFTLFYCGLLGSNYTEENARIRRKEFETLCDICGFKYFIAKEDLELSLKSVIEEIHPTSIYMPAVIDWHEEHRYVNFIVQHVIENYLNYEPDIVWYQITVPIWIHSINNYSELSRKDLQEKYKCFKDVYKSQAFMPTERFKFESRYAGNCCGKYAIESFCRLEFWEWKNWLNRINNDMAIKEFVELKGKINNLTQIYMMSEQLYNKYGSNSGDGASMHEKA